MVDLGLAHMDGSLEECEDEQRRLHNTLESMVGLTGCCRDCTIWLAAGPTSELEERD